jgi:predicted nucleic acid-binding Zn ribbon protein
MPSHEFECRYCGYNTVINTRIGESPAHPLCPKCKTRCAKNFSFAPTAVEIDVMSPSTGYHSSTRKYEDSLKRLTEESVNRTGFETEIVRAEPNDTQSRPVDS